jgi:hypothetical protein
VTSCLLSEVMAKQRSQAITPNISLLDESVMWVCQHVSTISLRPNLTSDAYSRQTLTENIMAANRMTT